MLNLSFVPGPDNGRMHTKALIGLIQRWAESTGRPLLLALVHLGSLRLLFSTLSTPFFPLKPITDIAFISHFFRRVSSGDNDGAVQRQTTVTDYLKSKRLLLFAFVRQNVCPQPDNS